MKIIKQIIKVSTQKPNQECNYTNDYYGDQVCTLKVNKK